MTPHLLLVPLDPASRLCLDEVSAGQQQIVDRAHQQGGTEDRRPILRGGKLDVWCLEHDPMLAGLEAAHRTINAALGLRPIGEGK